VPGADRVVVVMTAELGAGVWTASDGAAADGVVATCGACDWGAELGTEVVDADGTDADGNDDTVAPLPPAPGGLSNTV
jgi:hypothetical protein